MVYTGQDRLHDKMDREAEEARTYDQYEKECIYENFQPSEINDWMWKAMWNNLDYSFRDWQSASTHAKEMARGLGVPSKISQSPIRALPTASPEHFGHPPNRGTPHEAGGAVGTSFYVRPADWDDRLEQVTFSEGPTVYLNNRYDIMRREFLKTLVQDGKYPDIEKYVSKKYPGSTSPQLVAKHYWSDVRSRHEAWRRGDKPMYKPREG